MATDGNRRQPAEGENGRGLTPRQEAAALALAGGRQVKAAAEAVGIGERTLHRWRESATFRSREQELRSELFGLAVGRLCELTGKAADRLGELLDSKTETVALGAAKAILEAAQRLRETTELTDRMDALERQLAGDGGGFRP
jgi:transposase-like protein